MIETLSVTYDDKSRAIYIKIREGLTTKTDLVSSVAYADKDSDGQLLGLEILFGPINN